MHCEVCITLKTVSLTLQSMHMAIQAKKLILSDLFDLALTYLHEYIIKYFFAIKMLSDCAIMQVRMMHLKD